MTGYRQLLARELLEAWRTYRLVVIALLFLGLGISAPILTKYLPDIVRAVAPSGMSITLPPPDTGQVLDQLLKNVGQFGALAAILLAMGSVATERERGTAAFVLAKPVTRLAFLAAKASAIGIEFALAIGLAVAGAWLYTTLLFSPPPILPWLELVAVTWLATIAYAAITFLGSVVMRSSLGAAGVGFLGLIVLSILSIVPSLTSWLPAGLPAVAKALALEASNPDVVPLRTIAAALAIVAVALALAWWRFRRMEL